MSENTEIRFELAREDVSVLDGYCQATGKSRSDVMRQLLKEWSDKKLHEATIVLRVAGVIPAVSDALRNGGR